LGQGPEIAIQNDRPALDAIPPCDFQDRCLKPLGHPSEAGISVAYRKLLTNAMRTWTQVRSDASCFPGKSEKKAALALLTASTPRQPPASAGLLQAMSSVNQSTDVDSSPAYVERRRQGAPLPRPPQAVPVVRTGWGRLGDHHDLAARSGARSPYHPFQGNEGRKDKCHDSGEGDGKVDVMHGDQALLSLGDQNAPRRR
jgi:hypothetical protein